MIYFPAGYYMKYYNHLIHEFLCVEMYSDSQDETDELIELLMPPYLRREQFLKCRQVFQELYEWTADSFMHSLTSFHELALYVFIEYMSDLQNDIEDFNAIFFDEETKELLKEACEKEQKDYPNERVDDEAYFDLSWATDWLFDDLDFLMIPDLQARRALGDSSLEYYYGINIDYYFEMLPLDIQRKYKTNHITLTGELIDLIAYIERRIKYGSLNKLFWNEEKPITEPQIQLVLENVIDAYFEGKPVDITREAQLSDGKIDFKFYKNMEERVLIEIKRANSSYLKKGYEEQLLSYLQSSNYTNAFYLIVCFTDHDFERATSFIRENVYTDTIHLYINISILDARKRRPASKR